MIRQAPKTDIERQRIHRSKRTDAGQMQCTLWLPAAAVPAFRRAAVLVCDNPALTIARLSDRHTGRLRGLD